MPGNARPSDRGGLDDRSPYQAAVALMRAITERSDELDTEQKVRDALVQAAGPGSEQYIGAIAESGHSVFYHQIELLYELGRTRSRPDERETFCFEAGRAFLSIIFAENLTHILQIAFASHHEFQRTLIELLMQQIYFYAGGKYVIEPEAQKNEVALRLTYADPDGMADYLGRFGLEVEQ